MPLIQLTLDDKDIVQAVREYVYKLGYTAKSPISVKLENPVTVTVDRTVTSYGGCGKD
jgi:hypothetical protein